MATGSTNAAGRAEELRTVNTGQVAASTAVQALLELAAGATLDQALATLTNGINQKESAKVSDEVKALYGLDEADMNRIFRVIKEVTVPDAVRVSDEVKVLYGLDEADINEVLKTIAESTIPNAINHAIGDAMGGEY